MQFGRLGGVKKSTLQTLSDRLNRRERIVQFMPKNANEPLPRFALFVTQCAAQIGQHDEVMRQTSLAKGPATHPPAPRTARKSQLHGVRGFSFETRPEPEFFRGKSQQAFFRPAQQAFAGAIDQPQFPGVVEGEDRQVNLLHHGPQEGIGFQCAQALLPKYFTEGIHFDHDFSHGIVASRTAGTQRKVFFAQGCQKIRKRLQGKDDAVPQRKGEAKPERKNKKSQRPDCAGRIIAAPQENHGDQRTRKARC